MSWSRRQVLRWLGASTATPALASWLGACGGPEVRPVTRAAPVLRPTGEIGEQLREIVTELSRRFSRADGFVRIRRLTTTFVDAGENAVDRAIDGVLVLAVASRNAEFEQVSSDLSRAAIERVFDTVRADAAAGYQAGSIARSIGEPKRFTREVALDPQTMAGEEWLTRIDRLYARARRVGGSRIVYRSAYAVVEDSETMHIGEGHSLEQRVVRTRAGVVFVAQNTAITAQTPGVGGVPVSRSISAVPAVEVAERSGALGLEAADVALDALDAAADRALSIVTPILPPEEESDVVLEPSVAALVLERCVAPLLLGHLWVSGESTLRSLLGQGIASERVTLVDSPTDPAGFGSYFFDDQGVPARATTLIDAGRLVGALTERSSARALGLPRTANARRGGQGEVAWPHVSNLILTPGHARTDQLVNDVKRGLLLESGLAARVDPATLAFSARVARARQIVDGKLTGVLYGSVVLYGDIIELLRSVRGTSAEFQAYAASSALPASISSPFVLARARVAPAG